MNGRVIPRATYRLQFNRNFTFADAVEIVPYLAQLGISHCYASPYLRARSGSLHGYDIVNHHELNPEIGTPEDFDRFVTALHEHGMGQILDIVPNHMGIMGADNSWWLDVLENGEASEYADFFDIDWCPLKNELQGKVLVPVLADQYGTVLDRGELRLAFDKNRGEFSIFYFQHRFPVNPQEYPRIMGYGIEDLKQQLGKQNKDLLELESLIAAFNNLPPREESVSEKRAESIRDKETNKRRLAALCLRAPHIAQFLEGAVQKLNGTPGESSSFDTLHELIKKQAFRLAYWRVAADDINYRRFFDVNDLAALRQEDENVFARTHDFVLQLLREKKINGLRIDHPDGLYDPQQYFERLQRDGNGSDGEKSCYIVAEKILATDEHLPATWPIDGTTGYNFLNLVNGLFVDPANEKKMSRIYSLFIGEEINFRELVYECKKLVMERLLNSELNVLANHLSRIALADRHTCDFTLKSLRDALTEIVALFPVYRTYMSEQSVSESDHTYINQAVDHAIARNLASEASVYSFIRELLLGVGSEGHPPFYQRSVKRFAMKFQQYTSALMAKGLEDTCFYRYNRLISLNEVGGDLSRFGVEPEEFHCRMVERARTWPHEMLASSTHDTKRSEDVRARINVLSEMPLAWHRQVREWRKVTCSKKRLIDGCEAPTLNDEYFFYQTLVGVWPFDGELDEIFMQRIRDYMHKAIREAKRHSSWANPNEAYESALSGFVDGVLRSKEFRRSFIPFQRRISHLGALNSLSQTLLKLTVPGVPDLYQGAEIWDFSLVDPDNRRRVDYNARQQLLRKMKDGPSSDGRESKGCIRSMTQNIEDSRIKLFMISRALDLRKKRPELFTNGEYVPLTVVGKKARHLLAFARSSGDAFLISAVPRLCGELLGRKRRLPCGEDVWSDTKIELPAHAPAQFRNAFTGEMVEVEIRGERVQIAAGVLLASFPVGLLINEGKWHHPGARLLYSTCEKCG